MSKGNGDSGFLEAAAGVSDAWRTAKLGDVCEIQLGKMLSPISKTGKNSRPYLRNANVQWNRFNLSDVSQMDFTEKEEQKFRLTRGDVLVCEGGEPGRAAVWDDQITPCYYQKALHRLRPISNDIDPHFIMYRLWLGGLQGEFIDSHAKTTIAHLPAVRLAQLRIKLPPLFAQKRIVDTLNEQIKSVLRARKAAEEQLAAARALPAAYLREVFESEEAKAWPIRKLGELSVDGGQYGTSKKADGTERDGVPVLGMWNIHEGQLRWERLSYISHEAAEIDKYELKEGDVLFNRTNSVELVGKTAVFEASREAIFASYLIRFRINESEADPRYVTAYMNSQYARRFIDENLTRAIGQANISASTICKMPLPVPPVARQKELADELALKRANIRTTAAAIEQTIHSINKMSHALLRRAFSGEVLI